MQAHELLLQRLGEEEVYNELVNDEKSENTDTDEDKADNSIKARGLVGCLERIPLWLKLAFMSSIFLVGMIVSGGIGLGAQVAVLNQTKVTKRVVATITDCREVMVAIGVERYYSVMYLGTNDTNIPTDFDQSFDAVKKSTDAEVQKFYAKYPSFATTYPTQLQEARNKIVSRGLNGLEAVQYFESYVNSLKATIGTLARDSFAVNVNKMLITMEYVERVFVLADVGEYLFSRKFQRSDLTRMIAYDQARGIIGQYEIIGSLFRASAPMESIAIHDSFNTTNYDHTKRLLTVIGTQYAQGNAEIDATMYLNEWRNVCTTWQNERLIVGDRTLVVIDMSAQGDVISATSTVVWISVVVSGSFIIGILAGIGMAYSITGPWRRLSKLQDATIRKFVPSGFMKLVNTKSITDMVLGKYVERDITMLLVEIKNMKTTGGPSETLHFLNDFLSTTCPIVRKNGGFVDRYTGDGFTALFRDSKSAMVSAVEIQSQVEVYNSRASHQIVVGVTTHSAYALIGTVGENERMDGCVISKESSVNPRLQTVGDKLEAPIVATRQALSNRINHRFLGTVTHKQLPIEVFEVFGFGDALKRASTDVFNAAAKAFDKKQFFKAKEIFDKVINMNNEDKVAQSMARMCKKIIDQVELDLHRMRANEILAILPLRNALEEQCKKEFSTENIDLWKHIQTFRTMTDPVEMERFAKQLYSTYCDINGECSVNITDITRNTVKKKLFDPEYKIDKNLFDKLNIEIVSNLEDTAARFKDTESCRELYLAEMNIEPLL